MPLHEHEVLGSFGIEQQNLEPWTLPVLVCGARGVYLAKNISVHSVILRAFVQNLVKFGQKGVILAKSRHFCLFFRRALRALRAPIYVPGYRDFFRTVTNQRMAVIDF